MTRWVMSFECSASGEPSDGCSWSWSRFFWYHCWAQNQSGEWRVPMTETPSEAQTQVEEPTVSTPETSPESTPPEKERKQSKAVEAQNAAAGPQIKKVRLSDGSFHFLDHEKRNIALFHRLQFSSSM